MLVVASETVIRVLEVDLRKATRQMNRPQQLMILSGGTRNIDTLNDHVLPCDARLQTIFGGARMSLNIRTARWLLSKPPSQKLESAWRDRLTTVLLDAPQIQTIERQTLTDREVESFILEHWQDSPSPTWSRLLRMLRDSGFRCEQKRFAAIFKKLALS